MTVDRIKEIQKTTGYPDSISIQQALFQVWNEVAQENKLAIDEACKKQKFIAGEMATVMQRIAMRYNTVVSTEAVKKEFLEVFDKYFPPSPLDENVCICLEPKKSASDNSICKVCKKKLPPLPLEEISKDIPL